MANIDKVKGNLGSAEHSKNIHKSDSLSVGFDALSGTITIGTCADRKMVDVMICKDGAVIYTDRDKVSKEAVLNYVLDADETGEYELHVTTSDGESVDEAIVKEW